jgi:hypothetical protein
MAKACFCGCGRTIPLYMMGLRTFNTRGKQVAARLAWMRDGLAETGEPADAGTQQWLEEGDEIVGVIARLVHREADPRSVDESAIREWQTEGRAAEQRMKDEGLHRQAAFGHAVRASGRSHDEIANQLAHGGRTAQEVMQAIERGEDDPFGFEAGSPPHES